MDAAGEKKERMTGYRDYCPFLPRTGGGKGPLGYSENEESVNNNVTPSNEEKSREELVMLLKMNYTGLPKDFEEWTFQEMSHWMLNKGYEINGVAKSLAYLVPGLARPGDCGKSCLEKPEWFDADLFRRGQKFALDHTFATSLCTAISMCLVFTDKQALQPMIISGRSDTPYRSFKRYVSTLRRIRSWYQQDPWDEKTLAHRNLKIVRKYHVAMRKRLCESSPEQIKADSTISDPWSSIRQLIQEDASASCPFNPNIYNVSEMKYRSIGMNQTEMSLTQFMFIGLAVAYPASFGIHGHDEKDLEAFCFCWRVIGYLIGIEDEYNFCRGTFSEIKQRSIDVIETVMKPNLRTVTPEWEHMTRCMIHGLSYYLPFPSYEVTILYLTDVLGLPMPHLLASISYVDRFKLTLIKFAMFYALKIPHSMRPLNALTNACMDRAAAFNSKKHSILEERSTKTLLDFTVG